MGKLVKNLEKVERMGQGRERKEQIGKEKG